MKRNLVLITPIAAIGLLLALSAAAGPVESGWPHWRGPDATGAAEGNPPVTWSETENIKWKVAVPGSGHATPIIADGKIFLLTAIATAEEPAGAAAPRGGPQRSGPGGGGDFQRGGGQGGPGGRPGGGGFGGNFSEEDRERFRNMSQEERRAFFQRQGGGRPGGGRPGGGGRGGRGGFGGGRAPTVPYRFAVVCLEQATGNTLWEKTVAETVPHEGHHGTNSFASYSPVTDGTHLYVSFGSRGLYCLDFDGNVVWETELLKMSTRASFGEGSSPALAGDAVIVLLDHEGDSKIAAYDKKNGDLLWEKARDEQSSWSTPLPVTVNGRLEVIVSATNRIRSYDAKTGDIIWECGGQTANVIPTPVVGFDMVFCASGYRGNALQAIKLGQTGDLSGSSAVVWEIDRGTPYVSSPLLYDGKIYVMTSNRAKLSCYDAKTGAPVFTEQDLDGLGTIYASPVAAGGKIYVADREGAVAVLKQGSSFEVLASNRLDEGCDASPVVIGDTLFLRSTKHLYCIAED